MTLTKVFSVDWKRHNTDWGGFEDLMGLEELSVFL